MRHRAVWFAFLALVTVAIADEAPTSVPEAFGENAMAIVLTTHVAGQGTAVAWTSTETKYTIPGTPVSAKIVGENLIVVVSITPYISKPDGLVLVTQGQVWVRKHGNEFSYRAALNTVQVTFGEAVYFYPLGIEPGGSYPIKIEIVVSKYRKSTDSTEGATKVP